MADPMSVLSVGALEQVATSDLPTLSGAYADAATKAVSAHQSMNGVPPEPPELTGEKGAVFSKYNDAHNALTVPGQMPSPYSIASH